MSRTGVAGPPAGCLLIPLLIPLLLLSCSWRAQAWTKGEGETAEGNASRARNGISPYVRGPGYQFVLSQADLDSGVSYLPAAERLRVVVDKLQRGQNISLVFIGGSIIAGQGVNYGPSLAGYIAHWFQDAYPGQVTHSNGGVPGVTSAYFAVCQNIHVPADADLIIADFTVNDIAPQDSIAFNNPVRRAFERLLRKLLDRPNRPAVILLHAYAWHQTHPIKGSFWSNAEREFGEFERYYHLPALSTKAAVFHHMHAQRDGYNTTPREVRLAENEGKGFYYDIVHPDELTGCRMMAELVFHLVSKVQVGLQEHPLTDTERQRTLSKLPDPMIRGNFESASTRCFIGGAFQSSVLSATGFEWINEGKDPRRRPKWGYIATQPGSEIRLTADTRASSKESDKTVDEKAVVQLGYLRSYEQMGQASVTCVEGCTCAESMIEGNHTQQTSLMLFHEFFASPAERCIILVKVLPTTSSGQHKVKLMALIVSEVAGTKAGLDNASAIEFVGDIALKGNGATFHIENQR